MKGEHDPLPDDPAALIDLAQAARSDDDLPMARRALERAARLYREGRDLRGLVSVALVSGAVGRGSGDLEEAAGQFRSALALSLEIGWDEGTIASLEGMREVAAQRGERVKAEEYESQIKDIRRLMAPDRDPSAD